ncbi:MAG TPA: PLP-dependent aminotransferase family protein [Neobacillus sp.]
MFEIQVDKQSNHPIYQTLYTQIRNQIRSGKIINGSKLPSIRALQIELNISKTPIETAYQMLIAEGYVVSKPKSGLYVVNLETNTNGNIGNKNEISKSVQSDLANNKEKKKNMIDFNPTHIDNSIFPIRIWNKMVKEALENHEFEIGRYGDPQGELSLRELLCDYLFNARGVNCSPDQIFIGNGIVNSINIISKLLQDRGSIAIEDPGYILARNQFLLNEWHVTPIPVNESGLMVEKLECHSIDAVYVTPSHQFPTGSIISYTKRERLLNWASKHNAFIIEDDYDSEFRYKGKPISSLQGLDSLGRVIYIGTFSKVFTPALRINYMVLPITLLDKMKEISSEINSVPSRIDQWAMSSFIEKGQFYRHIRKVRNVYRKKHHFLVETIREHLGRYVEIKGEYAGIHLQLVIKTHQSVYILIEKAELYGVMVHHFQNMWMDENKEEFPTLYMGFAALSEKEMEKGILLLKEAWRPLFK